MTVAFKEVVLLIFRDKCPKVFHLLKPLLKILPVKCDMLLSTFQWLMSAMSSVKFHINRYKSLDITGLCLHILSYEIEKFALPLGRFVRPYLPFYVDNLAEGTRSRKMFTIKMQIINILESRWLCFQGCRTSGYSWYINSSSYMKGTAIPYSKCLCQKVVIGCVLQAYV